MSDKVFYRLVDSIDTSGVVVRLIKYHVRKETPKGYWVLREESPSWASDEYLKKNKLLKFTLKSGGRFVCETIQDAVTSLLARKKRQVQLIEYTLEQAKGILSNKEKLQSLTEHDFKNYMEQFVVVDVDELSFSVFEY